MKRALLLLLTTLFFMGCKTGLANHSPGESGRAVKEKNYTVTVDTLEHGAILAQPPQGQTGTSIILQVSPEPGYRLKKGSLIYCKGKDKISIDETTRTFSLPALNVTVSAVFEPLPEENYSVSVMTNALEHGVIVARPEFGIPGTLVHLLAIPDPGYRYRNGSLKYGDIPIDDLQRSFILPEKNVLITANFEPVPPANYTIRSGMINHGRIFAKPEFSPAGEEVYLHVIPDPGYRLKEKSLKFKSSAGETAITGPARTFIMPANHVTINAAFTAVPADSYTVGVENFSGGRVIPDRGYGKLDDPVYLHVIPDPGYALTPGRLKLKGAGINQPIDAESPVFTMPMGNVRIKAKFKRLAADQYTVRADMARHGRIFADPPYGKEETPVFVKINPDSGYRLKPGTLRYFTGPDEEVFIDGASRILSLPAGHVTIKAEFEAIPKNHYAIRINPVSNGSIFAIPESAGGGDSLKLAIKPDPKYRLKNGSLKYIGDDGEMKVIDETFTMPGKRIAIRAEFESVERTVYVDKSLDGGQITVKPARAFPGELISLWCGTPGTAIPTWDSGSYTGIKTPAAFFISPYRFPQKPPYRSYNDPEGPFLLFPPGR
jgi:hypothetical protein